MNNLKKLENLFQKEINAWYRAGLIMRKIRDEGEYKKKYGTFENYLKERWGYSKQHGHRLINSAEIYQKLEHKTLTGKDTEKSPIGDFLPTAESQIRPLLDSLKTDSERVKVWQNVQSDGKKITANLVQEKVDEFLASGEAVEEMEFDDIVPFDAKKSSGNFHISTGENEWYTPSQYIESIRIVLGVINLDPASNEFAQKTIKAEKFFTKDNCALSQTWSGNVFMNPPYSYPEIKQFVDKLLFENLDSWIVLTNNATETNWFQALLNSCDCLCFPDTRIKFFSPNNNSMSPRQGQAFFYYGNNQELFAQEFNQYGLILKKY